MHTFLNPHPASAPAPLREEHRDDLDKLSAIFNTIVSMSTYHKPLQNTTPASPRVTADPPSLAQQFPIGLKISKIFDDLFYCGTPTSCNTKDKYYCIRYEDNDED